ncbi:MAG: hypothetical protein KF746_03245 [Chitinophagaceae bacterium]|nr:hypothetical protein [Chitinophagaceae bacterium]
MVTGQWDKTSPGLLTAYFYDNKGRVIQTKHYNQTSGTDITTTQYNFSGQALKTVLSHQNANGTLQTYILVTTMTYDNLGWITSIKKKINADEEKLIVSNEYGALGQLRKKILAPGYNTDGLESLDYTYNIREWLLAMNRDYLNSHTSYKQKYVGFEIGYDRNNPEASFGQSLRHQIPM